MAQKCNHQISMTSVDMACRTTNCNLNTIDTAHHVADIINTRPGSLYLVELCSITMGGLVDFNGSHISITRYVIVASKSRAPQTSVNLSHLGRPGTEEIQTTIEFHDETQRVGNNTFLPPKESYHVDYEMDLL
jgi:hypothetical protein